MRCIERHAARADVEEVEDAESGRGRPSTQVSQRQGEGRSELDGEDVIPELANNAMKAGVNCQAGCWARLVTHQR